MAGHMNLNQLRIFHSAARLLNFTRAAEELHLTQPGISKHLKELEEHYGTRLFDRLGRKVVLTQAGEVLLEATVRIFNTLEDTKTRIDEISGLASGKLSIGAERTIATYLLPDKLVQFRQHYPAIEIRVETAFSTQIIEKVLDNTLELGLVGQYSNSPKLSIKTFMTGELVLVVSPQHRWAKRKTAVHLEELTGQTMLLSDRGASTWRLVEGLMNQNGIQLENTIELGTSEGVKRAVAANLGVSLLSNHVLEHELKDGEIIAVPLAGGGPSRQLYLIHHKDRYLSLAAQAFVKLLPG
jgi:DNA-binding transcriptional LysR family regulator